MKPLLPKKPHNRIDKHNADFVPGDGDIITGTPFAPVLKNATVEFSMEKIQLAQAGISNLVLRMKSNPQIIGGDDETGYFIAIKPGEAWKITLSLSKDWEWQFDQDDPLSFKDETKVSSGSSSAGFNEKNYSVSRNPDGSIDLIVTSIHFPGTHVPKTDPGDTHQFNLYVNMKQSKSKGNAIRFDPDVKNPPPGGSSFIGTVPAGKTVPI
jgi:hypothetical protein